MKIWHGGLWRGGLWQGGLWRGAIFGAQAKSGPTPFVSIPLTSNLVASGLDAATFTRASSATYIDANGILQTASSNEPRLTADGLLMEPAGTNLLTYSDDFSQGYWGKADVSSLVATTDPCGGNTAYEATFNDVIAARIYRNAMVTSTSLGAFSLWVKGAAGGKICIEAGDIERNRHTFSGYWERISVTQTNAASVSVRIIRRNSDDTLSTSIFGAQYEESHAPTSYIATTGTPASRAADSCSWPISSALSSALQSSGTIIFDAAIGQISTGISAGQRGLISFDGTASHGIYLDAGTIKATDGTNTVTSTQAWNAGDTVTIAATWGGSALQLHTAKSGTWYHATAGSFDGAWQEGANLVLHGSNSIPIDYSNIRIYDSALTDAELESL